MGINAEEIISVAIKLEEDGYKFYRKVAAKSTSRTIQKVFHLMAEDELYHIDWLKTIDPEIQPMKINRNLYEQVKDIFAYESNDMHEQMLQSKSDIDAVKKAIDIEDKTAAAYARWGQEIEQKEIKELCNKLVAIEVFHRRILENMIVYLQEHKDLFQDEGNWKFI